MPTLITLIQQDTTYSNQCNKTRKGNERNTNWKRNLFLFADHMVIFIQNNEGIFGIVFLWEVHQGCILSPCLFNLYAEYIMRNTVLEEAQAGIKIARSINSLRYADNTTLMAES